MLVPKSACIVCCNQRAPLLLVHQHSSPPNANVLFCCFTSFSSTANGTYGFCCWRLTGACCRGRTHHGNGLAVGMSCGISLPSLPRFLSLFFFSIFPPLFSPSPLSFPRTTKNCYVKNYCTNLLYLVSRRGGGAFRALW